VWNALGRARSPQLGADDALYTLTF
jgi:hypothetical protein